MLNNLSEYIRNIATFLVLISFIGIIIPNNKYRNYINLVMGFVLIFIMLNPISKVLIKRYENIEDIFNDMELNMNKSILAKEYKFYEDSQRQTIIETYKIELNKQVKNIVDNKNFYVLDSTVDIDESINNFGEILNINLIVKYKIEKNRNENKTKLITIEKVSLNKNKKLNSSNLKQEVDKEIKNLKIYLSDFYNLSLDNIYIKVQG